MDRKNLKFLALAILTFALLVFGTVKLLSAGEPPHCENPVCGMKTCQSYDKHGKPNGTLCSNDCKKSCCRCPTSCNRH